MRPISLTMYGFGPFVTKTTVEFEKLGKKGIFLITGTTGSGKTSIFDAIIYALYGKASGGSRDADMLKTLNFPEGEMPYVIYEFEVRNNKYVINRSFSYKRKSKRGEGFTDESAAASISCNGKMLINEKVSSKNDPVAVKVQEIIGVDYKQFKMLSILPQGEFERFLLAKTDERKDILQKLFDISIYEKFQERVAEEYEKLKSRTNDFDKNKKISVNKLMCSEESAYAEELSFAISDKLADDKLVLLIQNLIDEDKALDEQVEKNKGELNDKLQKVNQDIGKAKELQEHLKNLAAEEKLLESLMEQETAQKTMLENAEQDFKRKPDIDKDVGSLESRLKDYDKLDDLNKTKSDNEKFIEKTQERKKKNEETCKNLQKDKEINIKRVGELENSGENKVKLEQKRQELSDLTEQLEDLQSCVEETIDLYRKMRKKQDEAEKAIQESEQAAGWHIELNKRFNLAQAGILAKTLEDKKPCPVCGSIEHPAPACMASDVPSEKDVKEAQENANRLNEIANKASQDAASQKGEYENSTGNLNKMYAAVFVDGIDFGNTNWNEVVNLNINSKLSDTAEKANEVDEKIKEEEKNINLKKSLQESLVKIDNSMKELEESINKDSIELGKKTGEIEQVKAQIDELTKNLPYKTKAEIVEQIKMKKAESSAIQKKYEKATADFNEWNGTKTKTEGKINALRETDIKSKDYNLDELTETRKSIGIKIKEYDESSKNINSRIDCNVSCLKSIKQVIASVDAINKRLMVIEPIAKTMNGTMSGKARIDLETYVLQSFFNRIIKRANVRLKEMTNNNYELRVTPEQKQNKGKTGLELSVVDYFSSDGLERDVHSLSGGEKFKASLSLALGLSDEISALSGGIRLDSLYIDEGFGSLDRESLESAIKIINKLADGDVLVGIISHVEILKERVNKKIIVTKLKTGSSIEVET